MSPKSDSTLEPKNAEDLQRELGILASGYIRNRIDEGEGVFTRHLRDLAEEEKNNAGQKAETKEGEEK